ncbi:zinc-binding dehydrogenase [Amycolatopsis endophytica]|uniref:Threonine dehydrogenase-like Zn-dependent dehydrogenase n=1 Tax=Amycolatopsis endophytica TaxID=860233 RepID=A0A853B9B0_9PSEU|nr:zinc-binding dehydrogenase [Amycolatopsis endophytica]NYI91590.1 threonine dehydrogenase-like Zn-dependent dehydrogenase [Amycolatopsis endophytica]
MTGTGVIPEHTRAAVVRAFGEPITIEEVAVPPSVEAGGLLVEVVACSLCGTDVHCWEGSLALDIRLPLILGHEMVGRIVAIGEGAGHDSVGQRLRVGDRVIWTHAFCGRCRMCTAKRPAMCLNRKAYGHVSLQDWPYLMGGFAQHAYVLPGAGRVRVPDSVPDALASMASCALRSVVNAVEQAGRVGPEHTVVVQGAGPLGILATGLFARAGAGRVVTIGAPAARLELAGAFGADEVISLEDTPDPAERLARVHEATDGRGADLVAEFSGHPAAFAEGIDLAAQGGRYVVVGQLGAGTTAIAPGTITKKNLSVIGSFSGDVSHYHKALTVLDRYARHLPFDRLISGRYPLEDVNTVITRMQAFQEIKPVLLP